MRGNVCTWCGEYRAFRATLHLGHGRFVEYCGSTECHEALLEWDAYGEPMECPPGNAYKGAAVGAGVFGAAALLVYAVLEAIGWIRN